MGVFVERYRYAIGSVLLGLILTGATFLLWRENRWKPDQEKRLDTLALEIEQLKISGVQVGESAQAGDVNPSDLIKQIETKSDPTPVKSGKVAGASALSNKTSSKAVTSSKPATTAPAPSSASAPSQTVPPTTSGKPPLPSNPININTASAFELTALPSIGTVTAQNIIDYRNAHGPFTSVQQLDNVKNIGEATINKIKDHITVN